VIVTVMEVECVMEPVVAVILTLYVPGAAVPVVTFRVELPDPPGLKVRLAGFRLVEGPAGGTTLDSVIVPENPLTLFRDMVEISEDP